MDREEKTFLAFCELKDFVKILPYQKKLLIYLDLHPTTVNLEKEFIRDMTGIGHNGRVGKNDVEFTLKNPADLEKLKPYLERAYREHLANPGQP